MMGRVWTRVLAAHELSTRVAFLAALVALFALAASYVYEVVARYLFNAPTTWSSDFVGYMLCISTFLAFPMITMTGRHVAVLAILERMPTMAASQVYRLIDIVGVASCSVAAWYSFSQNFRQYSANVMTLANDPIPKWWITMFITFGLAMSALHFLRRLMRRDNMRPVDLKGLGVDL